MIILYEKIAKIFVRKNQHGFLPRSASPFRDARGRLWTHEMKAFSQTPRAAPGAVMRLKRTPACMWASVPGCPARLSHARLCWCGVILRPIECAQKGVREARQMGCAGRACRVRSGKVYNAGKGAPCRRRRLHPARACPTRAKQPAYLLDIFNAQK